MVFRETDILTLSQLGRELLRPERIRLKLSDDVLIAPVDIGSLAYSIREKAVWKQVVAGKPVKVDPTSLQECRRELVAAMLDSFYVSGARESSILFSCRNFRYILDWCDQNGFSDVFSDEEATRRAYLAYNDHLRDDILVRKALKPVTCAGRQSHFVQLVQMVFSDDSGHITHGVPTIRPRTRTSPEPPRECELIHYVRVCADLAKNFSQIAVEGQAFPLEKYCAGQRIVIFPSNVGLLTPRTIATSVNAIYNYDDCRLATVEEYVAFSGYFPSVCARGLEAAQRTIMRANADLRSAPRFRLASMALDAYVYLFALLTGASPSELRQFERDEALEIEKSLVKREFSAVKFRAGGKKTRYLIGRGKGLQLLRDYLKLRSWVLEGKDCKYLFISLKRQGSYTGEVQRLSPTFSYQLYERLRGIFIPESFPHIAPSRVRKYKSLVLHELKTPPEKVAATLNHTPLTNNRSYSETTVERYEHEYKTYWRAVRRAAERIRNHPDPNESSTAVGHCDGFDSPSQIAESVPITPSCRSQYGCLYCANYVCHADEEDVHKLVSFQFVINSVRALALDVNHADRLFRDISLRIELILEEISNKSGAAAEMVKVVKHRVFELGDLTPFWEKRLQRYEMMGVVF